MHENQTPMVTCLLPVFNGEKYLRAAIDSVLAQTYADFELLIINDQSTDGTEAIVRSYTDPRIRLLNTPERMRLVPSLNYGIQIARGRYVARMDADDISHPERFRYQVELMERNPDLAVLGTDIVVFSDDPSRGRRPMAPPTEHWQIRFEFIRNCCIYHPTVMLRKSVFADFPAYDPQFSMSEDYELWLRLTRKYRAANVNRALLFYRKHSGSVSQKQAEQMYANSARALATDLTLRLGEDVSAEVAMVFLFPFVLRPDAPVREFVRLFFKARAQSLRQPGVTRLDTEFIYRSASWTLLRLTLYAARRAPHFVPICAMAWLRSFDWQLGTWRSLPFFVISTFFRKLGLREKLSLPSPQ